MLPLAILSVLLLAVTVFALQNAQPVTVQFVQWQLQSSVAVVTLAAMAAGVLIAALIGLASRVRRWQRGRPVRGGPRVATLPVEPRPSAGPSAAVVDSAHGSGGRGSMPSGG